jgi:hypothetical protein
VGCGRGELGVGDALRGLSERALVLDDVDPQLRMRFGRE